MNSKEAITNYLLELADDHLVLGHRLSEWCGHAPTLEEDIALANLALDCIGVAQFALQAAAETEDKGRTADDLAFFRNQADFKNCLLVEQVNGDFAKTIVRQFFFDNYACKLFEALSNSSEQHIAGIAAKALKEAKYHLRHSSSWVIRLGDGTAESKRRVEEAVIELWKYTDELFKASANTQLLVDENIVVDPGELKPAWESQIDQVFTEATLSPRPNEISFQYGAREGRHSEHLGHLLAEMQITARSHPGAEW